MKKMINRILIFILITFLVLPIVSMIIWAFFSTWQITEVLPSNFTLSGFQYFFSSKDWLIGIKSVLFSVEVAISSLILATMSARYLISKEIKNQFMLETIFYLPMLLPVISICIGSHKMFLSGFLTSGVSIFILHIYFAMPYAFKMIYSYYTVWGIEEELTARGLGANWWQAFKYINLPIYIKGYSTSFFMAFIISYSQYFINLFIGNSNHINFSMIMTPYITSSNRNISAVYTLMYIFYSVIVMQITSIIVKRYSVER